MPRLFTGLEIPSETALMLSMLRGGLRGARWIDPENYHITLRFIGDIDDRTADEVVDALDRIRRNPIEIRLDGLGSFGNGKPHAVWAGVQLTSALSELQSEQERILHGLLEMPTHDRIRALQELRAGIRLATNRDQLIFDREEKLVGKDRLAVHLADHRIDDQSITNSERSRLPRQIGCRADVV